MAASLRLRRLIPLAGTLGLAALPKCPFCLMALFGAGASAGFAATYSAWLLPALAAALLLTAAALAYVGAGSGTVVVAVLAATAVLVARTQPHLQFLLYPGMAGLLLATALGVRSGRGVSRPLAPQPRRPPLTRGAPCPATHSPPRH